MDELKSIIEKNSIKLIIWDFDGVIFKMDWNYEGSVADLLTEIYEAINEVDSTLIEDKDEFITKAFPYPEITEVGVKHGKEQQDRVKDIFRRKESAALHMDVPIQEVIEFIKQTDLLQAIWSNNLSSTIGYLLKQEGIEEKISCISSIDKVIKSKPNVEGFELIKKEFPEIDRKEILLIGDSLISDKVAAENTGIGFFHYS